MCISVQSYMIFFASPSLNEKNREPSVYFVAFLSFIIIDYFLFLFFSFSTFYDLLKDFHWKAATLNLLTCFTLPGDSAYSALFLTFIYLLTYCLQLHLLQIEWLEFQKKMTNFQLKKVNISCALLLWDEGHRCVWAKDKCLRVSFPCLWVWNALGRQSWLKTSKIPGQLQFANLSFNSSIWNNHQTSRNRFHRLVIIAALYIVDEKCILQYNQNDNFFNMLLEAAFATEDKAYTNCIVPNLY